MKKSLPSDRRQFGRRETQLHAIAVLPGRASVHCVVTNLSDRGAHIAVSGPIVLPQIFRLRIDAIGLDQHCNLRHQGQQGAGVVFVNQAIAEKIAGQAEEAARRRQLRTSQSPKDSGAQLREELQAARDATAPPEDMRALEHVPGRVIRGI